MTLTARIQTNGTGAFALIKSETIDMSVLLHTGMTPRESLNKTAEEMRRKADLLQTKATLIETAGNLL